jgi:hypothetical protein
MPTASLVAFVFRHRPFSSIASSAQVDLPARVRMEKHLPSRDLLQPQPSIEINGVWLRATLRRVARPGRLAAGPPRS